MLVLYGAGNRCRILYEYLQDLEFVIVDSDKSKWGKLLGNHEIYPPEILGKYRNIRLCITIWNSEARQEIKKTMACFYHCCEFEEVGYHELLLELMKKSNLVPKSEQYLPLSFGEKINVIFDCYLSGLGLGGVEAWTKDICQELLKHHRINPYILSKAGQYDIPDDLKDQIIPVKVDLVNRYSEQNIRGVINKLLPKLPCKVVTCITDEVMVAAYLIKQVYPDKIEIISVVHSSFNQMYEDYMEFKECSDRYVAVSKDISRILVEKGIAKTPVLAMTCPFRCEENLVRTYSDNSTTPIRVGYAGRLDGMEGSQKRMDLQLQLITELVERKIHFVFEIAGDGPVRPQMEEFITSKGYEKYVSFLGNIDRKMIPSFWKKQDILVNCADFEGHSIMQLEAMGNGAVPVVTDVSGVRDDIINDVNGYYVPTGDYIQLADKIEYLYEHRKYLAEMGKRAHDAVYPKSSMSEHIRFWESVLLVS